MSMVPRSIGIKKCIGSLGGIDNGYLGGKNDNCADRYVYG